MQAFLVSQLVLPTLQNCLSSLALSLIDFRKVYGMVTEKRENDAAMLHLKDRMETLAAQMHDAGNYEKVPLPAAQFAIMGRDEEHVLVFLAASRKIDSQLLIQYPFALRLFSLERRIIAATSSSNVQATKWAWQRLNVQKEIIFCSNILILLSFTGTFSGCCQNPYSSSIPPSSAPLLSIHIVNHGFTPSSTPSSGLHTTVVVVPPVLANNPAIQTSPQRRYPSRQRPSNGILKPSQSTQTKMIQLLPEDIKLKIIQHLPPHLSKSILINASPPIICRDPILFALDNLSQLEWQGEKLKRQNWCYLGKSYVAAFLLSVPVCIGVMHCICPHMPVIPAAACSREDYPLQLLAPCCIHKELISDAIEMILERKRLSTSQKKSTSKLWPTCYQPMALHFFTALGRKELLKQALQCIIPTHPVMPFVLRDLYQLAYISLAPGSIEALEEYRPKRGPRVKRHPELKAATYAATGSIEKLAKLLESKEGQSWGERKIKTFLSATRLLIQHSNLNLIKDVNAVAHGLNYLACHLVFRTQFYLTHFKRIMFSDLLIDIVLTSGFLKAKSFVDFVQNASAFAITRMDNLLLPRESFRLWLERKEFSKICVQWAIKKSTVLGQTDVVTSWLKHSVVKSQPWIDQLKKKVLCLACQHTHLDLVKILIEDFDIKPTNETLSYCLSYPTTVSPSHNHESIQHLESDMVNAPLIDHSKLEPILSIILSHNVSPSINNNLPIRTATETNQPNLLRLILSDWRLNLTQTNPQDLIHLGSQEIYRICQEDGRFDFSQTSPLDLDRIRHFDRYVMTHLLSNLNDKDRRNARFLLACRHGDIKRIQPYLCTDDIEVNVVQGLMLASEHEHVDIVDSLINFCPILLLDSISAWLCSYIAVTKMNLTGRVPKRCFHNQTNPKVDTFPKYLSLDQISCRSRILGLIICNFLKMPLSDDISPIDIIRILAHNAIFHGFLVLSRTYPEFKPRLIQAYVEQTIDSRRLSHNDISQILASEPTHQPTTARQLISIAIKKACPELFCMVMHFTMLPILEWDWLPSFLKMMVSYSGAPLTDSKIYPRTPTQRDILLLYSNLLSDPTFDPTKTYPESILEPSQSLDQDSTSATTTDLLTIASTQGHKDLVQHLLETTFPTTDPTTLFYNAGKLNVHAQHEILGILWRSQICYPAFPNSSPIPTSDENHLEIEAMNRKWLDLGCTVSSQVRQHRQFTLELLGESHKHREALEKDFAELSAVESFFDMFHVMNPHPQEMLDEEGEAMEVPPAMEMEMVSF
ncbi:hypothetical protein HDU97_006607 [Phlyctochytrium planicorne]|nr:hypothetical protein HDU97_006607 [Phlyctochytrium planicorne]